MNKARNKLDSRNRPLRFLDLEFGATGSQSVEFSNLPLLALETTEQQKALNQLIPLQRFNAVAQQFREHILRLLALISVRTRSREEADVMSQGSERTLRKIGSAQEFDEACILSRFLKNDKFCFCNRHALRLEQ